MAFILVSIAYMMDFVSCILAWIKGTEKYPFIRLLAIHGWWGTLGYLAQKYPYAISGLTILIVIASACLYCRKKAGGKEIKKTDSLQCVICGGNLFSKIREPRKMQCQQCGCIHPST